MDKIKDLQKKEKETLQKGMDYFNASSLFGKLTNDKKQIVFDVILDLLPDKKIENCGYYFQKLLDEKGITYTELANYIIGYLECMEMNPEQRLPEDIKSKLQKLLEAKSFKEDNYIIEHICNFFSVSEDVLLYGYGKRYQINMEIAEKIFNEQNISIEQFIRNIKYKTYAGHRKYCNDCDYYILNSDKVFAEKILIEHRVREELQNALLKKEDKFSLIDEKAFLEYFMRLKENERTAVLHLMENMKKELDN